MMTKANAEYELAMRQGRRYQESGDIKDLKPTLGDVEFMEQHGFNIWGHVQISVHDLLAIDEEE